MDRFTITSSSYQLSNRRSSFSSLSTSIQISPSPCLILLLLHLPPSTTLTSYSSHLFSQLFQFYTPPFPHIQRHFVYPEPRTLYGIPLLHVCKQFPRSLAQPNTQSPTPSLSAPPLALSQASQVFLTLFAPTIPGLYQNSFSRSVRPPPST